VKLREKVNLFCNGRSTWSKVAIKLDVNYWGELIEGVSFHDFNCEWMFKYLAELKPRLVREGWVPALHWEKPFLENDVPVYPLEASLNNMSNCKQTLRNINTLYYVKAC
jgi:hypothetical protein